MVACAKGYSEIVGLLLRLRPDVNVNAVTEVVKCVLWCVSLCVMRVVLLYVASVCGVCV